MGASFSHRPHSHSHKEPHHERFGLAANSFEPLADDTVQRLLVDLEAARATFAESVGRYRGSRFTSQAALATEAQDYRGRDAVALGLADAAGHGLDAFDGFVRAIKAKK